jgi:hypothetical protein
MEPTVPRRKNSFVAECYKGPLGRPSHRWEDNIKMDLREIGWGGMDWIGLAQDRDQ